MNSQMTIAGTTTNGAEQAVSNARNAKRSDATKCMGQLDSGSYSETQLIIIPSI
jgi:hypothetical protein